MGWLKDLFIDEAKPALDRHSGGFGSDDGTYILVTPDGDEIPAVMVSEETVFTATDNDVREGVTYVSDNGASTGTRDIPSYHTTEGYKIITSGSKFETMPLGESDKYDYTRLQAIICPLADTIEDSVAAEKVAIDDGVYAVNSTELLATVIKDSEEKTIYLGIINEGETPYLMRYFTYKEIH